MLSSQGSGQDGPGSSGQKTRSPKSSNAVSLPSSADEVQTGLAAMTKENKAMARDLKDALESQRRAESAREELEGMADVSLGAVTGSPSRRERSAGLPVGRLGEGVSSLIYF